MESLAVERSPRDRLPIAPIRQFGHSCLVLRLAIRNSPNPDALATRTVFDFVMKRTAPRIGNYSRKKLLPVASVAGRMDELLEIRWIATVLLVERYDCAFNRSDVEFCEVEPRPVNLISFLENGNQHQADEQQSWAAHEYGNHPNDSFPPALEIPCRGIHYSAIRQVMSAREASSPRAHELWSREARP